MMYVTAEEIKMEMPDTIALTTTTYDPVLRRMAEQATDWVDRMCRRTFWPRQRTVLLSTLLLGADELWIPDCLSITSVSVSDDDGQTYADLVPTDYLRYGGRRMELNETPYRKLVMSVNGDYGLWYAGENAAKVIGLFGWHDDYASAWETLSQTVANDPKLSTTDTLLLVANADAKDVFGLPLIQVGQVLRLVATGGAQEMVEAAHIDYVGNKVLIKRARLGTAAIEAMKGSAIEVYRPTDVVRRVASIQAMRWFKRAQQGWADAGGGPQVGQLIYAQRLDPDIVSIMGDAGLRRVVV